VQTNQITSQILVFHQSGTTFKVLEALSCTRLDLGEKPRRKSLRYPGLCQAIKDRYLATQGTDSWLCAALKPICLSQSGTSIIKSFSQVMGNNFNNNKKSLSVEFCSNESFIACLRLTFLICSLSRCFISSTLVVLN